MKGGNRPLATAEDAGIDFRHEHRLVAVLRLFDTMSEEELARQIAWPSGVLDPRTMSYSELETLLDELRPRRSHQTG